MKDNSSLPVVETKIIAAVLDASFSLIPLTQSVSKSVGITLETHPEHDLFSLLHCGLSCLLTYCESFPNRLPTSPDHALYRPFTSQPVWGFTCENQVTPLLYSEPCGNFISESNQGLCDGPKVPIWSLCPYSLCLSELISSHGPLCSLLLAILAFLPVLECARHNFPFASSQVSVHLVPFLPSCFYSEVSSSVRLPQPSYLKLQPTLLQIWHSLPFLPFVSFLCSSYHSLTCMVAAWCVCFSSPWSCKKARALFCSLFSLLANRIVAIGR